MKPWILALGLIILAFPFPGMSQNALEQQWVKAVAGNNHVGLFSLKLKGQQILMAGYIDSAETAFGCLHCTSNRALLVMTDSSGNQIFSHCYGGTLSSDFVRAKYGLSGSIWALGYSNATDGDFPDSTGMTLGVVKFDSLHNPLWYRFLGSKGENDIGDFITTSDGGALLLATTNNATGDIHQLYGNDPFNFDAYLMKLDSAGNIKWTLILGGSGDQSVGKLREPETGKYSILINTNSVDYMLAGLNFDSLNFSPWLLEIDTGGNILSSRVVHGMATVIPQDFIPTGAEGVLFGGNYDGPQTDTDICYPGLGLSDFALVKVDSEYHHLWCKIMGGSDNDVFYYMNNINDSIVALFGNSLSTDGGLIRCNSFGYSVNHGWVGLLNTHSQELIWQTSFCSSNYVVPEGMAYDSVTQSLYLLMTGGVDGDFASAAINGTTANTYLFKYGLITTGIKEITTLNTSLNVFPNPANNDITIKVEEPHFMSSAIIFDAVGRKVASLFNNAGLSVFNFNCNKLSTGLYFIKVADDEGRIGTVKFVKE